MPLAFESLSHGTIAFGFFNIESDMLLLDHYFFFANDFCKHIEKMADCQSNKKLTDICQVYHISDPQHIGDLNGAIHGIRYYGFIGEVYRRYPFPEREENFKQKTDGHTTRSVLEETILKYAQTTKIKISVSADYGMIDIGPYCFSRTSFHQLINYVWRGGYPRWKDEVRPDYVMSMKETLSKNPQGIFDGVQHNLL